MSEIKRLIMNKPMPELHFVFAGERGSDTVVILDADRPDLLRKNLDDLTPMTRRVLAVLCEATLEIIGDPRKAAST